MSEIILVCFVIALLGMITSIFAWKLSRERIHLYLSVAFGSLAFGGILQGASALFASLEVFGEGWEAWGLILVGFGFLYGVRGKVSKKEEITVLASLLVLSFVFAFLPGWLNLSREGLVGIRAWQIVWACAFMFLVIHKDHPAKKALTAIFSLWLLTVISDKGKAQAIAPLFVYLGLLFIVYRSIFFSVRRLERKGANLLKLREQALSLLEKIGVALQDTFDLEGILELIMDFIMDSSKAKAGAIFLLSDDKKELTVDVVLGIFPPLHKTIDKTSTKAKYLMEKFKADRIQIGEGVIGEVAATGKSILIKDALNDPRAPEISADYLQVKTMVVAPLKIKDEVFGVIALVNKKHGEFFSEADDSLLHTLGNQAAISINNAKMYKSLSEKDRLEKELQIARDIQGILFPKEAPRLERYEMASLVRPATEVGGDYFDYIKVSPDELGIAIADVSGKGVPGALVMAMTRSTLRAKAVGRSSAAEVLTLVNRSIYGDIKEDMFVSIFYLVLNLKTGVLKYARAGHEPALIFHSREKRCALLDKGGMALGLDAGPLFEESMEEGEIKLNSGDILALYTDGITEAMNEKDEEFSFRRFREIVCVGASSAAGIEKVSSLVEIVDKEIAKFVGDAPQLDDITLVALRAK